MKVTHSAPASDLYSSPLFLGRRRWVERSCDRWFILSAKYGLVDPRQVIAPYDVALNDMGSHERRHWSAEVLNTLEGRLGALAEHQFEIHAGSAYVDFGLADGLVRKGGIVSLPAVGLPLGRQLQLYGDHSSRSTERDAFRKEFPAPRVPVTNVAPLRAQRDGHVVGGKYGRLAARICAGPKPMTLSFMEIDELVGGLPGSARSYRAWWANDLTHSQARAWLPCGRSVVHVDIRRQVVTFT